MKDKKILCVFIYADNLYVRHYRHLILPSVNSYSNILLLSDDTVYGFVNSENLLKINTAEYKIDADMRLSPYKNYISCAALYLRPVLPEDSKYFYCIYTNPSVMQYYGEAKPLTEREIDEMMLRKATDNQYLNRWHSWSIITYEGIVGEVGALYNPDDNTHEISYILSPAARGKGIASIATKLLMDFIGGAFCATVHPENKPSIILLERLGFKRDPSRQGEVKYNSIRDYFIYPCPKSEKQSTNQSRF